MGSAPNLACARNKEEQARTDEKQADGLPCGECNCRLPSAVGSPEVQYCALWRPQPSLKLSQQRAVVCQQVQNAMQKESGHSEYSVLTAAEQVDVNKVGLNKCQII